MATFDFVTVDVFTARRFGGNPLAVFPDARGLNEADMQAIAAEFNLSETTFVLPPKNAQNTAMVRIFTPKHELPFAGHPNVGTGFVLADHFQGDKPLIFEEAAGLVEIRPLRDAAGVVAGTSIAAPLPLRVGAQFAADTVASCAGLSSNDLLTTNHPPQIASVGTEFIIAEVASVSALAAAQPDFAAFRAAAASAGAPPRFELLIYCRVNGGNALRMRMFAPLLGIIEDPATGSAAAALCALLVSKQSETGERQLFNIEQGSEMGRPSQLQAYAMRDAAGETTAGVGGLCVPVLRGTLGL